MGGSSWQRLLTGLASGLFMLSGASVAADLRQQFDDCATIEDDTKRLACFDALASAIDETHVHEESPHTEAPRDTAATAATDPATTSTDSPTQSPKIIVPARTGNGKEIFAVRMTSCSESSGRDRQVYYFDNGEVWQRSNSSRNNVKNCDTPVLIERDAFGYKMRVESEGRNIRIRPVR